MSCRFCNNDAVHQVPFEAYDENRRAIPFLTVGNNIIPNKMGIIPLCGTCHAAYGDYIRKYYSPRFELGGAL